MKFAGIDRSDAVLRRLRLGGSDDPPGGSARAAAGSTPAHRDRLDQAAILGILARLVAPASGHDLTDLIVDFIANERVTRAIDDDATGVIEPGRAGRAVGNARRG